MATILFWVDIEDAAGAKIGAGPLRPTGFRTSKLLSASGQFSFEVSPEDPNIAGLAKKRIAVCRYLDDQGIPQTFGGGVIDRIVTKIGSDGSLMYDVGGNDLLRELTYRSVGALSLSSAGAGVTNGPAQIMALAPAGWTLTGGITQQAVYAGFDGEPVLNALSRVGEHIGEHWRLGTGRNVTWLGPYSGFPKSGVRAVQHFNDPAAAESVDGLALISNLEEVEESSEILTRVIPRGSGNGGAIVTLAAATDAAPAGYTLVKAQNYLKRNDAEAAYGRIEAAVDFKEIGPLSNSTADVQNAANMLLKAAHQHLRRYGAPRKSYKLELAMAPVLEPGTSLHVVYRKTHDGIVQYDLNQDLLIVEVEQEINSDGLSSASVTVSNVDKLPESDDEYLAGAMQAAKVLSVHQQLGPSVDTMSYRDEMDDGHGINLRFWLGEEYTSIQRAVLRFRVGPLRSTVKSVGSQSTTTSAGGGGTSTSNSGGGGTSTSNSGGGGSTTSSSGGGQTATGGSHQHRIDIASGGGTPLEVQTAAGLAGLYSSAGPADLEVGTSANHNHDINAHTHGVNIPSHSHDVTIPGHSHDVTIPSHTHQFTPQISMDYGIFEESSANTLALADLVIKVNSSADLRALVVALSGGWYELDITDQVVDDIFRPQQESNTVAITTAIEKTARIEAQITIRGVVQAVAYQ